MKGFRVSLTIVASTLLMAGCPQQTPAVNLSEKEIAGIISGVQTAAAVANAFGVAQAALQIGATSAPVNFGTCPVVTLDLDSSTFEGSANINFGTGCTPAGAPGLTISGSANGTAKLATGEIDLAFVNLTCNGDALNGTADVNVGLNNQTATIVGGLDVTVLRAGITYVVTGNANASFDRITRATTISTFAGTASSGSESSNVLLEGAVISFAANGNFRPSSGTLTINQGALRIIIIRFDSNTPSTGEVQVSVNGGAEFTVDLDTL